MNNFLKIRYFSRFTYKLWKESHFTASRVAAEKSWKLCIACLSLTRIINDQIMKVPKIGDFYNTLKKNTTVACVVDDSHTVET